MLTKVWLGMEKTLKGRQSKGNNFFITDDTLMKLHVHGHTSVIYIQYTLHETPSIAYKAMAEQEKLIEKPIKGNNSSIDNGRVITLHA